VQHPEFCTEKKGRNYVEVSRERKQLPKVTPTYNYSVLEKAANSW